ncbi:unnamed protein product, partial [Musa textilis]
LIFHYFFLDPHNSITFDLIIANISFPHCSKSRSFIVFFRPIQLEHFKSCRSRHLLSPLQWVSIFRYHFLDLYTVEEDIIGSNSITLKWHPMLSMPLFVLSFDFFNCKQKYN